MHRRTFVKTAAAAAGGFVLGNSGAGKVVRAEDKLPSPAENPRATSGDHLEPNWAELMTITVGPQKGDLVGSNGKVIQAAIDSVARWGGGTVKILPGTYRLRNAIYLQSGVRVTGSGVDSVVVKDDSLSPKIASSSDWYDQEIVFRGAAGLQVGDGICITVKDMVAGGTRVIKRTLVARIGNRFKLDRALRDNLWLNGEPQIETLFPLFSGENLSDVTLQEIAVDGNKSHNGNIDGSYAACVWMQDCIRMTMRNVTACNFNGDGISWQVCHDVRVEGCHSYDHVRLGLHPGSGSQRSIVRGNRMVGNEQGLYFCWGVRYGIAEENYIENSKLYGISIGHRDTDNVIRNNEIRVSGKVGILFRDEHSIEFQGNRNLVEKNRVFGISQNDGVGIDVQGQTESVTIAENEIRSASPLGQRVGIRIGPRADRIALRDNHIEGFAQAVLDLRSKPPSWG